MTAPRRDVVFPYHGQNSMNLSPDLVVVSKSDIERLRGEIQSLYKLLPSLTSNNQLQAMRNLPIVTEELRSADERLKRVESEREHWRSRWVATAAELSTEREEKFGMECSLQESERRFSQQSEYCANMGAVCGTLLWKLSRSDDNIQSILSGCKVEEFLSLVSTTLVSYTQNYQNVDLAPSGEDDEETQFVLSLCGVLTNIAASAFGRDFLMKNAEGLRLLEALITVLYDVPVKRCSRIKILIMMTLYNLSINQKGLKILRSKSGILNLLVKHVQEETDTEIRLNSIRLIESLLCDEELTSSDLMQEATHTLSKDFMLSITKERNQEIRSAAIDLMTALRACHIEQ